MIELSVPVAELAAHLKWVAAHVPTRPAVPVLAGICLTAGQDRLTLEATDYDTWATATVEAHTTGTGTAVLPGRLVDSLVGKLPADTDVHLQIEEGCARLRCGPVDATLRTLAADDYPEAPETPPVVGRCEAADLAPAATRVAATACTDQTLPVLTSLRLAFTENGLTLASTDRYRASHAKVAWNPVITDDDDQVGELLVPAATLARATRGLAGEIALAAGHELIALTTPTRTLMLRTQDGEFPTVEALHESNMAQSVATVTVDTAAMSAAVERARVFASAQTPVRLHLAGSEATVSGGQEGDQASEMLPIGVEGDLGEDGITLGMNAGYLLGALASTRAEQAHLAVSSHTSPVIVTGESEQDWTLAMPVRLAGR